MLQQLSKDDFVVFSKNLRNGVKFYQNEHELEVFNPLPNQSLSNEQQSPAPTRQIQENSSV